MKTMLVKYLKKIIAMITGFSKTIAVVLLITASAHSCNKEAEMYKPDCESGNCRTVNIKGSLKIKPSGEGLNKIPVEVNFYKRGGKRYCFPL